MKARFLSKFTSRLIRDKKNLNIHLMISTAKKELRTFRYLAFKYFDVEYRQIHPYQAIH